MSILCRSTSRIDVCKFGVVTTGIRVFAVEAILYFLSFFYPSVPSGVFLIYLMDKSLTSTTTSNGRISTSLPCHERKAVRTESQGRVGWDALDTLLAVSKLGGDDELSLSSNLHTCNTFVPSLDDFTFS